MVVPGHRGHVDPALEPRGAAEDVRAGAADRLPVALDFVAAEQVERRRTARVELEVRQHHQEVVVVAVRLVELAPHSRPGFVVQ